MTVEKVTTNEHDPTETALSRVASAAVGLEPTYTHEEEEYSYPGTAKLTLIMLSVYVAVFLIALDRTIIGVVIPKITDEFNALNDIGWYGSAYQLTAAAFILPYGRIYTFCSTKWTFMSGILIFEIGSALCGAAPNSTAFIIGRAIAGLGSSGIFTGGISILVKSAPLHKRPVLQGLFGACFAIASVAGPLIGGAFSESSLTWRWSFYINLPLGGATIVALFFFLKLKEDKPQITWSRLFIKLDPLGNLFFLPAIVCLVLALQWGGVQYDWSTGRVIGLLVAFGVCTISWFVTQYFLRHTYAMVPSRILKNRAVWLGSWFQFVSGSTFLVVVLYLPIWFQAIKGVSPVKAGIDSIPMILALVIASITSGGLVARFGYYVPFLYVSSIIVPIGAGLLTTLQTDSNHSKWIGYQIIFGFGLGSGMQQSNLAVQTCLPERDVPTGVAVIFFFQMLGGAVFSAVSQNVFIDKFLVGLRGIPGVSAQAVVRTGATEIRRIVPSEALPQVLKVYNHALTKGPFTVSTIMACLAIFGAIGMEWRSVKEKKTAQMASHAQQQQQQQQLKSKDLEADGASAHTRSTASVHNAAPTTGGAGADKV